MLSKTGINWNDFEVLSNGINWNDFGCINYVQVLIGMILEY